MLYPGGEVAGRTGSDLDVTVASEDEHRGACSAVDARCRPRWNGKEEGPSWASRESVWWRWRESNPRPKRPPLGVYKLKIVICIRSAPSHDQDDASLAFRFSPRFRKARSVAYPPSRRLCGVGGKLHQTSLP